MVVKTKNIPASETFVYRVVNDSEHRLDKRLNEIEGKNEERYNNLMNNLDAIITLFKKFDAEGTIMADKVIKHESRISKLEKIIFNN